MNSWRITGSMVAHGGRHGHVARPPARHASPARPGLRRAPCAPAPARRPGARRCSLGRKTMATPYSPGGGRVTPPLGHFLAVELVRDLDQDAGAVAHQLVGPHARRDGPGSPGSSGPAEMMAWRLAALDVGDQAHAAGVMLVGRVIELPCAWRAGGGIDGIGGCCEWSTG